MTTEQRAFFELVKSGLWGTEADAGAFDSRTDWPSLYRCGKNQAMLGVMLDGIGRLPESLRPPRALYLQWCASVMHTEENNHKLNAEIGRLCTLLRAEGIEPVLLKGQGVAQNYPEPLHRQCGDIDIYIGMADFERVNRLLGGDGYEAAEARVHHCTFTWHGVEVENHRILTQMYSPCATRRLHRWVDSWHGTARAPQVDIEGCRVTVPPVEFDAVFVLQHAVHHLLGTGVGLRQVCDWACLLHSRRATIDRAAVARELRRLHLVGSARAFGALAVRYLGLPAEDLPVELSESDMPLGDWLLEDIWSSGNFGRGDSERKPRPKGYWSGKWHTFVTVLSRGFKLWRLAPVETLWLPYSMISNLLSVRLYMLRRR